MAGSKTKWTAQQEKCLQQLHKKKGKNQWSAIAKDLNNILPGSSKNAKQCRDRFVNYIRFQDDSHEGGEWGQEQWKIFIQKLHIYGPKWTQISKFLPGKFQFFNFSPENRIKNKFYGLARKAIKIMNNSLKQRNGRDIKPIKLESLVRILRYEPEEWRRVPKMEIECENIKKRIFELTINKEENCQPTQALELIERLHAFNMSIRCIIMKNSKNKRKGSKGKGVSHESKDLVEIDEQRIGIQESRNTKYTQNEQLQVELEEYGVKRQQQLIQQVINQNFILPEVYEKKQNVQSGNLHQQICMILDESYYPDFLPEF